MQHFTMGQYFNRMNIVVILSLLIPILSFIAAYTVIAIKASDHLAEISFTQAAITVALVWVFIFLFSFKKIKSVRNDQGLGLKLEKYFRLTTVRYSLSAALSMLLVAAFYITKDDRMTGLFAANMIIAAVRWPLPSRVCRELRLKGDEREMVYHKKDAF